MATSSYFNNFEASSEKQLFQDLIVESIKIYGIDVFYCPRTIIAKDPVFKSDALSQYNSATMVEMYIKSVDGFEGDGVFLSKFGLQIRDQMTLTIAVKTFADEVGIQASLDRPREGDLVYIVLNPQRPQLFQIKYVNDRSIFYQLGGLEVYDLSCEVFEYSGEQLNTGIPGIDMIGQQNIIDMRSYEITTDNDEALGDGDGRIIQSDFDVQSLLGNTDVIDNETFKRESSNTQLFDWSEKDPFSGGLV
jgi:hypothetical protein